MIYFFAILIVLILLSFFVKKKTFYVPIEPTIEKRSIKKEELLSMLTFEPSIDSKGKYLVFDTETTGLIKGKAADPQMNADKFPLIVQISWMLFDLDKKLIEHKSFLVKQYKKIPTSATQIHGITTERTINEGVETKEVLEEFRKAYSNTKYLVAHNIDFDWPMLLAEYSRNKIDIPKSYKTNFCTMKAGIDICRIPFYGGENKYKYPSLEELFHKCFFPEVKHLYVSRVFHDAKIDTLITAKCFFKIIEIDPNAESRLDLLR